jgi:O-6-methylguanine DNA methyltransferase
MRIEWNSYEAPFGPLTMAECDTGPLVIEFPARADDVRWAVRLRSATPSLEIERGPCVRTVAWLDGYFAGRPERLPFPGYLRRWFDLSAEQVAVFRALMRIPFGETRAYDDVARATGLVPRQIGQLVAGNHLAILIPCHRVVGKDGALVGYGGGLDRKRWLLGHELRSAGVVLR